MLVASSSTMAPATLAPMIGMPVLAWKMWWMRMEIFGLGTGVNRIDLPKRTNKRTAIYLCLMDIKIPLEYKPIAIEQK